MPRKSAWRESAVSLHHAVRERTSDSHRASALLFLFSYKYRRLQVYHSIGQHKSLKLLRFGRGSSSVEKSAHPTYLWTFVFRIRNGELVQQFDKCTMLVTGGFRSFLVAVRVADMILVWLVTLWLTLRSLSSNWARFRQPTNSKIAPHGLLRVDKDFVLQPR